MVSDAPVVARVGSPPKPYNEMETNLITRNHTPPKSYIGEALTLCGLSLAIEIFNGGCWRNGVEGHVHNSGDTSGSRSLGSRPEALPVSPTRFVEVNMGTV